MVVVKVSETYDLHTMRNEMGVLGIHSPSTLLLEKMYPGFFRNYKYVRIKYGNITCACASYLPADPLQVGVTLGKVAPQDMFNPILYKAVSNDSFETILSVVYQGQAGTLTGGSVKRTYATPSETSEYDSWDLYYGFLGQPGWKKAMPQAGFSMKGLKPLVFEVLNTFGNQLITPNAGNINSEYVGSADGNQSLVTQFSRTFRGRTKVMPRLPTVVATATTPGVSPSKTVDLPVAYCGCVILPPSKLNTLYYRLRVTWYIEFSVPRTVQSIELMDWTAEYGGSSYYTSYADASKDMENTTDSVDTIGLDIEKVMEN